MKRMVVFFALAVFAVSAVAKDKSELTRLKLVGEFAVPEKSVGTLTVVCDAERGNLLYYMHAEAGKYLGGTPFAVHQPEDCFKKDGMPNWRVLRDYDLLGSSKILSGWCDAERGNLVYVSLLHYGEINLGYGVSVLHQPESCTR